MIRAFSQQIQMCAEAEAESGLRDLLRQYDIRLHPLPALKVPPSFSRASVLVPLFWENGEWHVLLTIRSEKLRTHSGAVSFPGGKQDQKDENEVATALRESEEEIGLSPTDVKVVSVLPPALVRPNNIVTPVVAVIPKDFVPKTNTEEVRKVFRLPISRFLKEDYTMRKFKTLGIVVISYYFSDVVDGETIQTWGFTAQMVMRIAMVVFGSDQKREVTGYGAITKDTALASLSDIQPLQQVLDKVNLSKL
ncbi:peroxisomal coenzyme A diphosphatase NUDT7-like isoform X1 [Ylistrum balloti]|uniref:peroxisomal coenzyme A diphosphatase NUDT7-like isoform X1 n=1 Tax=Ylistrum balloti TaxID=509963 RepID=UPI002905D484|nr:peroxisomal coenzyme A diphosphatase NUDT7-like isoform X1 [Ylistrum balloti]